MISIQVTHTNPGVVASNVERVSNIRKTNGERPLIEKRLKEAKENAFSDARYKTGAMRESIAVSTDNGVGQISVGMYYSRYIEGGSSHNRAFPFFFGNVHAAVELLKEDIRNLYMSRA